MRRAIDLRIRDRANDTEHALQRLARERLKQGVAEHYGIPVSERSKRIVEDDDMFLAQRDPVRCAVDVATFAYPMEQVAADHEEGRHRGRFTYRHTPTFSTSATSAIWLTNRPGWYAHEATTLSTIYANGTNLASSYDWYSTSTRPYQYATYTTASTFHTTASTSSASSASIAYDTHYATRWEGQQFTYTITDEVAHRVRWGQWMDDVQTVTDEWRLDVWHAWERDARANHEGMIRDWAVGDWVDQATYDERQRERQAAADERRRVQQEHLLAEAAARETADRRAEELLRLILTDQQWAAWERGEGIVVRSQHGRRYRVNKGWAGNVEEIDARGRRKARFCIHPSRSMPVADNVAAQILMLKTDEDLFLATANRGA